MKLIQEEDKIFNISDQYILKKWFVAYEERVRTS